MTLLPFSPLTLAELNVRVQDANATIVHTVRNAHRAGNPLDDWDLSHIAEAAEAANAYADAAIQRANTAVNR